MSTMNTENLSNLSLAQLKDLLSSTEAAIDARRDEELKVLVDGFVKKLQGIGLPVNKATTMMKLYLPRRTKAKAANRPAVDEFVLYANPADRRMTWGGKGRRPAWLIAYLGTGGDLEDLKV